MDQHDVVRCRASRSDQQGGIGRAMWLTAERGCGRGENERPREHASSGLERGARTAGRDLFVAGAAGVLVHGCGDLCSIAEAAAVCSFTRVAGKSPDALFEAVLSATLMLD